MDADAAGTLMNLLPAEPDQLVTKDHLDRRLASEFAAFRTEIHGDKADLRPAMHQGFAAQTKWLVGTMVGSTLAFGSLVTAAFAVAS